MKKLPDFSFEKKLWTKGYKIVAGLDEVGRGCFAGPVVCGCVVFHQNLKLNLKNLRQNNIYIDDSKKLTSRQREIASKWIKKNALSWGVGVGTISEINRKGLSKATHSGFRRAVVDCEKKLNSRVEFLLIDAFYIPYIRHLPARTKITRRDFNISDSYSKQLAVVNGDEKIFSISCASIIAKVYRDKLMQNLGNSKKFKKYGWISNKGYGTKKHLSALKKYGATKLHRKKFIETWSSKLEF